MNSRKKIFILIGLAFVVGIIVLFVSVYSSKKYNKVVRQSDTEDSVTTDQNGNIDKTYVRDSFDGSISYNGERYEMNTAVDAILFLGIDSSDQSREGIGIVEGGRSDTIILFVIDNEKKLITPLEINRDTMVDVDIYDNDGNFLTQGTEQLTMQYAYGNTVSRACNLTKEKVSDLLGRKRIKGVVSLTIDGIVPIVDSIGGINLKLQEDETYLDETYVEGAVIHLDGNSALDYVHTRDVETRGSNIQRMSRQTQFMMSMFQSIKENGASVVETMENAAGDYLYEDVDADSIDHLTKYEYSQDVLMLPGVNKENGIHDEFYVDEDELNKMVLELFYKKAS